MDTKKPNVLSKEPIEPKVLQIPCDREPMSFGAAHILAFAADVQEAANQSSSVEAPRFKNARPTQLQQLQGNKVPLAFIANPDDPVDSTKTRWLRLGTRR